MGEADHCAEADRLVSGLDLGAELPQHSGYVAVAGAREEGVVAFAGVAPLEDLDIDVADAPGIHLLAGGHVDINGVAAGKIPAVIVDDVDEAGIEDAEHGAGGPAAPIGGGAIDGTSLKGGAKGVVIGVAAMVGFAVEVGGGADALEFGFGEGRFPSREGALDAACEKEEGGEEEERGRGAHRGRI